MPGSWRCSKVPEHAHRNNSFSRTQSILHWKSSHSVLFANVSMMGLYPVLIPVAFVLALTYSRGQAYRMPFLRTVQELVHAPAREMLRFDSIGQFHGSSAFRQGPAPRRRDLREVDFAPVPAAWSSNDPLVRPRGPRDHRPRTVTTNDPCSRFRHGDGVPSVAGARGQVHLRDMLEVHVQDDNRRELPRPTARFEYLLCSLPASADVPAADGSSISSSTPLLTDSSAGAVQHLSPDSFNFFRHPVLRE